MSKDVVKIKMKDMQGRELPGNFICKKKETAYFLERFTNSLFIVDNDDKPVGIIGFHDLLKAGVA